jgi:hypothetical protein
VSTVLHHAIDVAATAEACWKTFADLRTWPRWFPRLKHAAVVGTDADPWRLGCRFDIVFDFGPVTVPVRCEVKEAVRGERVRWMGRGFGITGDHSYSFASHHPGLTRVTSHEELTGVGTLVITRGIRQRIDREAHDSMARLKGAIESAPW